MMQRKRKLLLVLIVTLALLFRFQNLEWDEHLHLHPDERFLVMVGNAMTVPSSFSHYLSPEVSTFNPANVGYPFFVYGTLPVVLNKLVAGVTGLESFDGFTLQGRFLSACADMGTFIVVMLFAALIVRKNNLHPLLPYLTGFLYAGFVLPIQSSHFFISDSFLSFAVICAVYFAYRFGSMTGGQKRLRDLLVAAIATGLAGAVKVTGIFVVPLVLYFLFAYPFFASWDRQEKRRFVRMLFAFLLFGLTAYYTLRIMAPYYFQTGNVFDPTPSRLFVANIRSLKALDGIEGWFPPAIQWMRTMPVLFPLVNMAVLGMGMPAFGLALAGMVMVVVYIRSPHVLHKEKKALFFWIIVPLLIWVWGVFLYFSVQFVKVMRYFLFLYPFFALFGSFACVELLRHLRQQKNRIAVVIISVFILLAWPFLFSTIYWTGNTRALASKWIYKNVPSSSFLLGEYWDDPLPMPIVGNPGIQYRGELLHVFDQDTREKWEHMETLLAKGDYYILSSNRGWGSIPTVPFKYPRMSQFYDELFAGKTSYHIVKMFVPWYHQILFRGRVPVLSDWMDESFTVYDHPTVIIFKNTK